MNQKKTKKLRKEIRREARNLWGEASEVLGTLIRARPKYIPRFLWILLYVPIFKTKTLKIIYQNL